MGNSSVAFVRNCIAAARYVSCVIVVGNSPSRNVIKFGVAVVYAGQVGTVLPFGSRFVAKLIR
jgi:hypothetical protein